jgi:hypothetical protein
MGVNLNRISGLRLTGNWDMSTPLWFCLWRFSLRGWLAVQERGGVRVTGGQRMVDEQRGAS